MIFLTYVVSALKKKLFDNVVSAKKFLPQAFPY